MRRSLPPLHALRAFEAAARLGRMTAAAQELSVTPGAISRQVRQLEDALGVALFEGPKHQPRLTEAGAQLRPALSQAFDTLAQAVDAVRPSASGPVDVACFHSFMLKWLIPRLPDFHRQHPVDAVVGGERAGNGRNDAVVVGDGRHVRRLRRSGGLE